MFKVLVDYPNKIEELQILKNFGITDNTHVSAVLTKDEVLMAQQMVEKVKVDESLQVYIVNLIWATRQPDEFGLDHLSSFLRIGGSPRATLSLVKAARALAFLNGRDYVTAEDVKTIVPLVLRHRLILSFEAQAEGIDSEAIIKEIIGAVSL